MLEAKDLAKRGQKLSTPSSLINKMKLKKKKLVEAKNLSKRARANHPQGGTKWEKNSSDRVES